MANPRLQILNDEKADADGYSLYGDCTLTPSGSLESEVTGDNIYINWRLVDSDGAPGQWRSLWSSWVGITQCSDQYQQKWGIRHKWREVPKGGYTYDIRFGDQTGAHVYGIVTGIPPSDGIPVQPAGLTVVGFTTCSVSLTWEDLANNEESFEVQRSDDGGTTWVMAEQLGPDMTSFTDTALLDSTTYRYRVRAVNSIGPSLWSNVVDATTDAPAPCDSDGDGLQDVDERLILTNPKKADTDGDGLLDAWEVQDSRFEGDGFRVPEFPDKVVTRDQVFGPYRGDHCELPDSNLRFNGQVRCFSAPPDPRHKDVFLEIDWQDCGEGGCPHADPMHHAPDLQGLAMVIDAFAAAPVSNPDGRDGVNLRILIDEAVSHDPNCDQDLSLMRGTHFGTEVQRGELEIIAAKERTVRYAWSGHSSYSDSDAVCPTPSGPFIVATGLGFRGLEDYDWSPFGDANVGGRDILITLGPVWSCPSQINPTGVGNAVDADCDRESEGSGNVGEVGIYPTKIDDGSGPELALPWPVARMLGVHENDGVAQLWGRTLMHLLGHSLGLLSEGEVRNAPDLPAVDTDGDSRPEIRLPESYASWAELQWAPLGDGIPIQERTPAYEVLAGQDHDGDGIAEGVDNCPGVYNPNQSNADGDLYGDACDGDADADGLPNRLAVHPYSRSSVRAPGNLRLDPYPFDTDNDGAKNAVDRDDDGDQILDKSDNCPLEANVLQVDSDGDGFGDRCDADDNADGLPDAFAMWLPHSLNLVRVPD